MTGVKTGQSTLTIPVGSNSYTAPADWYFPTQADGSVQASGIIYLQHGFLASNSYYSSLATSLAQQTNSIVVAPTLPSFPSLFCEGCYLGGAPMQQGVAELFLGNRAALTISASQAGYQGALPQSFVLSGHSAGGGLAAIAGGYYEDALAPGAPDDLLGVVMFDGVALSDDAFNGCDRRSLNGKPVYQIAAPPQALNLNGQTTFDLIAARPDQFVGAELVNGSHVDSMLGSNPLIDFFAQLVTKFSPPGNTAAVYTLANGWINDFYTRAPRRPRITASTAPPVSRSSWVRRRASSCRPNRWPPPPRSRSDQSLTDQLPSADSADDLL